MIQGLKKERGKKSVTQFDPVHSSLHTHVSGPMQVPPPFSLLQPPLQGAVHTHKTYHDHP